MSLNDSAQRSRSLELFALLAFQQQSKYCHAFRRKGKDVSRFIINSHYTLIKCWVRRTRAQEWGIGRLRFYEQKRFPCGKSQLQMKTPRYIIFDILFWYDSVSVWFFHYSVYIKLGINNGVMWFTQMPCSVINTTLKLIICHQHHISKHFNSLVPQFLFHKEWHILFKKNNKKIHL